MVDVKEVVALDLVLCVEEQSARSEKKEWRDVEGMSRRT